MHIILNIKKERFMITVFIPLMRIARVMIMMLKIIINDGCE